jgi:predicted KAP-like P-loop ATPase
MTEAPFSTDVLKRQGLADRLAKLIKVLAESEVVPAGRVIAVDSPWGSGKTWLAERLPSYLTEEMKIGRCVYVNAFQFDFHHDPFAVLASAILNSCKEHNETTRKLRTAAGAVLKATLPGFGKGLVKVGAKSIGIDVEMITDAISDAAGKTAEKAVNHLLSSFEETTSSTIAFKARLLELAATSGGPLTVVVDELDRCRPDFALNLLERVKHLFDVQGVVFLLFVHTPAIHSAIRQTYGAGIDPAAYLRKFISITLQLPITDTANEAIASANSWTRSASSHRYSKPLSVTFKTLF